MIVQIRGAPGSGKSTLVRNWLEGRLIKKWMTSQNYGLNIGSPVSRPFALSCGSVVIPGHYEAPGGGCDMIKSVDHIYDVVDEAQKHYPHILMEGLFVSKGARRFLNRCPKAVVLFLDLPEDECRASVANRRATLNKPPKHLSKMRQDWQEVNAKLRTLEASGCAVERHTRQSAAARLKELLP